MPSLYSYVVRYDSCFAPNPFHGICTLATCKPRIRQHAKAGDWIVGTGSNRKGVRRGGFLVHAMQVDESLTFAEYWGDPRFTRKKPDLFGSYCMACGDNIYRPDPVGNGWRQLNSYHSEKDGTPHQGHLQRDTGANRVLVSGRFAYFGAEGPQIPQDLKCAGLIHQSSGYRKIEDPETITALESWLCQLGKWGYRGKPYDMIQEMEKQG
ncbi:MAG: hypothetical protein OXC91_00260 [Rhodobacteraceae bacterium]|nr:hypothetical protein [Paracoccaceae bacterium]